MTTICWIHGDNLSPKNPALQHAPDAPAIWVWDEALLARYGVSLKRIVFMYECLLELPVEIYRGDVAQQVSGFAERHGATAVATAFSPAPRFEMICQQLRDAGLKVEIFDEEPFVEIPGHVDLKRFSRYWRKAVKHL